jgi:hypothetical protein
LQGLHSIRSDNISAGFVYQAKDPAAPFQNAKVAKNNSCLCCRRPQFDGWK